ncbi:MAG: ABC transporter permease [Streptococcaceae bacterium]|jgi:simple sugar transport system permease protein|nr:ABC transporter permease [Streptococcaceae bacterium]
MISILNGIIQNMLSYSTPLILTSIGGVYSERGGIVNVGLEGIMTMGAFSSVVFNVTLSSTLGSLTPWFAILFGGIIGLLFSLLHAVATINLRADHIISGTVLNLLAPALGVFLLQVIYGQGQEKISNSMGLWNFPGLSSIPVIGPIFFANTNQVYFLAILVAILSWYIIFKTRFGLRLRSVGENPQAADTLGINVYKYRYAGVMLSGLLGGFGGAVFAQNTSAGFAVTTIAGQGFISLAAMIFGKWNPIGAMGASLLFGFFQSLAFTGGSIPGIKNIPGSFLQMAPYVLTIIVLALFLGKAVAPKADGTNYIKSK